MYYSYSAAALALVLTSSLTFGQECPPGYAKEGQVNWVDCKTAGNDALQCATLEVPLDWSNPSSSEKLQLRLVRQPAAAGTLNPKSIIINPGGPGDSGIKSVVNGGSSYQDIIGDGFHIIGFDPRGVGLTKPYNCPKDPGDSGSYNTDAGLTTAFNYNVAQAQECAGAQYGSDLIGTAFVARDIKAIAAALGEDGLIRYWGYSYGTLLGATLAAMFPDLMDRVILDGNVNPNDYYRGLGQEGSADTDRAVARFFQLCASAGQPNCALANAGQNAAQLQGTFDSFLRTLSYDQAYIVRDRLFETLYFKESNAFVDFATTLSGYYADPSTIKQKPETKRQLDWKPDYAKVDVPLALSGITCGDVVTRPSGSPNNYKLWLSIYQRTSKYGGDLAISILYQCSTWTVNAKEKFTGAFNGIRTKNPVLFLNTQYDPVTPLISAQNSAMGFANARVLVSSGVGHCTTANDSPELNNAVKNYMITGTIIAPNKIFAPAVANPFASVSKRSLVGPATGARNVEYPRFFQDKPHVVKRIDIPTGCTKIAASSTPVAQISSSPVATPSISASVQASLSASLSSSADISQASPASSSVAIISSSPVATPSISASVQASSSASLSSSTDISQASPASSSVAIISSTPVATPGSISASVSGSSSASLSSSADISQASSASSLAASVISSAVATPASISAAISSSLRVASLPASSSGAVSQSSLIVSPGASSTQVVTSQSLVSSAGLEVSTRPVSNALPTLSAVSSTKMYDQPNGSSYNVNAASSGKDYTNYPTPSNMYGGSQSTAIPYATQAWSSQPDCIPITKTYTTTSIETVTNCRNVPYCALNSATPTMFLTKTLTGTTVVAIPTKTVYTTSVVDVCSTGLKTDIITVTRTCKSGCTGAPTGIPQGYSTTVKFCSACPTPSMVTVTSCTACTGKISTISSRPSTPIPVIVPSSSMKGPTTLSLSSMSFTLASNKQSEQAQPTVPTAYESISAKSISAAAGLPAPPKTTTLQPSVVSTGSYPCSGTSCTGTPTATGPALFTGAAARERAGLVPVAPALLVAGLAYILN